MCVCGGGVSAYVWVGREGRRVEEEEEVREDTSV